MSRVYEKSSSVTAKARKTVSPCCPNRPRLCCKTTARIRARHPNDPGTSGAQRRQDDDVLHTCSQQGSWRRQQSCGRVLRRSILQIWITCKDKWRAKSNALKKRVLYYPRKGISSCLIRAGTKIFASYADQSSCCCV